MVRAGVGRARAGGPDSPLTPHCSSQPPSGAWSLDKESQATRGKDRPLGAKPTVAPGLIQPKVLSNRRAPPTRALKAPKAGAHWPRGHGHKPHLRAPFHTCSWELGPCHLSTCAGHLQLRLTFGLSLLARWTGVALAALTLRVSTVELGLDTLAVRLRTDPLSWAGSGLVSHRATPPAPGGTWGCQGRAPNWEPGPWLVQLHLPHSWAPSSSTHLAWPHALLPRHCSYPAGGLRLGMWPGAVPARQESRLADLPLLPCPSCTALSCLDPGGSLPVPGLSEPPLPTPQVLAGGHSGCLSCNICPQNDSFHLPLTHRCRSPPGSWWQVGLRPQPGQEASWLMAAGSLPTQKDGSQPSSTWGPQTCLGKTPAPPASAHPSPPPRTSQAPGLSWAPSALPGALWTRKVCAELGEGALRRCFSARGLPAPPYPGRKSGSSARSSRSRVEGGRRRSLNAPPDAGPDPARRAARSRTGPGARPSPPWHPRPPGPHSAPLGLEEASPLKTRQDPARRPASATPPGPQAMVPVGDPQDPATQNASPGQRIWGREAAVRHPDGYESSHVCPQLRTRSTRSRKELGTRGGPRSAQAHRL